MTISDFRKSAPKFSTWTSAKIDSLVAKSQYKNPAHDLRCVLNPSTGEVQTVEWMSYKYNMQGEGYVLVPNLKSRADAYNFLIKIQNN
jgi:hypothetical protein